MILENLPKPLTQQETYDLFKKINEGDKEAKEKLALHNIRLVISRVNKKLTPNQDLNEDMIEVGIIGLVIAINTFDTTYNNHFSTYAIRCIDNEIAQLFRNKTEKANLQNKNTSLDAHMINDNINYPKTLMETLSMKEETLEEIIINKIYTEIKTKQLYEIIPLLPERRKQIILLYYGFYGNRCYTQKEIGNMFNISQQIIGYHIKEALKFLKKELEKQDKKAKILLR